VIGKVQIGTHIIPLTDALAEITIRHGRETPTDGPTASTCTLILTGSWPEQIRVGDALALDLEDGTPRFRGTVTDMALEWVDLVGELTIQGAGNVAIVSRAFCGAGDYPAEAWDARVARVMQDAGWSDYVIDTPLPAYQMAARAADQTTVNAQLDELAATGAAAICDEPSGTILFQALEARQPQASDPPPLDLAPDDVAFAPGWVQVLDLVNVADIAYGPIEDSHTVTSRNADSVSRFGERSTRIDSRYASSADASARGGAIVQRRGYPRWALPGVEVFTIITPRIGQAVNLTSLPSPSPLGSEWQPIVEGWIDSQIGNTWSTTLQLSDPVVSGVSLPWMNLPIDLTWDGVNPACSWSDAYAIENLLPAPIIAGAA
jgi:hypothetical protein